MLLLCGLLPLIGGCCAAGPPSDVTAPPLGGGPPRHRISDPGARRTLRAAGIDPDALPCNDRVRWVPHLDRYARQATGEVARRWGIDLSGDGARRRAGEQAILGYLVRTVFQEIQPHNLGVLRLRGHGYVDSGGRRRPLLAFRSGVIFGAGRPGSCDAALIARAGVRHVVNLYAGHFPLHDVIAAERQAALRLGATHYDERRTAHRWRGLIEDAEGYRKNLAVASRQVARLIREQILRPGGRPPRGNVHFHCGGGMHRSGMVFGILQRCVNGESMAAVERSYRRHTGARVVGGGASGRAGGFEPLNLRFIREFDCRLLGTRR